ncbi:hypothetical protein GDO81_018025 [Engystomops pustulosus]|uniref:CDK5 regulatory subunit-associated protein 2/Myomegalin coiled coil domain-containing protein n=1 Tax=Engystomops pustulosus TaxID=76066 RepID=A0AAV7A8V4_ENGPU|nr:hypothetical protein GDO81_018025 [Engystomops pustulosus]KAG8556319.1 hypothetical protein GDO81_018025 [Engystomops pustulosus]
MKEYQLEVSALQSIIMKQNEQLREQGADIDTLTRTIQIKDELIKDLQVKLVDPEDIPTVELLTQQIFTLKENIASLNLASRGHLRHTQKIFNLLEELAANKSRLNEALQAEKQLYSCLVQSHTEADSSTLHSELAAAQALRGQLEDALMRTMEQLVTLQSENKQGGICDNNSSEKKKVQHTEPQEDENGIMKAELQKLKNELQHSSIKTNRMEEELHIRKPEINDDLRFSTPDWRPVKHNLNKTRKFDLNMEKASGTLEQGVDKNEMGDGLDMSKEIRKQKAEFNMDKNQRFVGQLERKITAIINDTNERIQKGMEIYPAKAGQSREGSLKRGLNGSNPIVEGAIPKMTPAWRLYSTHNDSCPAASCLPVCSSMQECPQEPLLETQNTKLHEPLISSNENQSGSNLDKHFLKHETRDTHMDFLDLGYETCGKSENELDREETTSPECEEDEDMLNHMVAEDSNCQSRFCMDTTSSKNKCSWHSDQKSDVEVLQKHMSKLKDQLETSQELMKHLQNQSCPSLKSHSFTEDDEGWQSDTNVHHSYTFLEQLAKRVSKLESYFYNFQKDAGTQHHIKQIAGPGEYNWLIQAQARELSLLRQKVKEGESISCTLTQNTEEAIKSFEEMLRVNDIDYFMGQNFREHLNQGSQLAKKLNSKLQSKGLSKVNKSTEDELHTNRNKIKILQKDLMETFQSTPENRSFSPSSHESVQSDSSIILDDQLSDELDVCSGLSVTSDCSSYEDSTQDSDMCYNSVLVNDTQMEIDSRNGVYIFCHSEDFSALKKNVLDGKSLLNNIQSNLQSVLHIPHPQVHGNKVKNNRKIDALFSAIKTLNNILEDSNSILGMFWSGTSPTKEVNRQTKQERVMKEEICTLKNKLHEQAVLLQKASDHVKHTNCAREGMEKLILKQLTTTCGALKKAKLNLLVKCNKKVFRPSFQQT